MCVHVGVKKPNADVERIFMRFLKIEFVAIFLGLAAGIGLPILSILFSPWNFVGQVPSMPTKILTAHPRYVQVQTFDSKIYVCETLDHICNVVDEYQPPTLSRYGRVCGTPNSRPPLYPGRVLASLAALLCYPHDGLDHFTIALDDGTLWTWADWNTDFTRFISGVFGAFAGAVAGIFVYLIVRLRSYRYEKAKRGLP
jgi:hypothetical protein